MMIGVLEGSLLRSIAELLLPVTTALLVAKVISDQGDTDMGSVAPQTAAWL